MERDAGLSKRSLRTRADIRNAALRLAETTPLDQITVDQIAAEAQVSRRTFHYHFANRREAFIPDLGLDDRTGIKRFEESHDRDLFEAVRALLIARVGQLEPAEHSPKPATLALLRDNESLQALIREKLQESDALLRRAASTRLHVPPETPRVIVLAGLIGTIERCAMDYWAQCAGSLSMHDALEHILQGFHEVITALSDQAPQHS